VYFKIYIIAVSRLQIAALHFNENADKEHWKVDRSENVGTGQWLVSYPKYHKGGAVAKEIKVACTYGNKQGVQYTYLKLHFLKSLTYYHLILLLSTARSTKS